MSENKRIYVGSGKQITGQYGTFRSITLNLSKLTDEHKFEYNGQVYIKLNVNDKDEVDDYGKDVNVSIDTWKPENKQTQPKQSAPVEEDEFPF